MALALTQSERDKRWELYNAGLCDQDIADGCGVSRTTIGAWRAKHRLPCHRWEHPNKRIPKKPTRAFGPIPMQDALDQDQCEVVSGFLRALVCMANQRPGRAVDVGGFMSEYRRGGAAYEQIQR